MMLINRSTLRPATLGKAALLAALALASTTGQAQAQDAKGWDYANSSFKNGISGSSIGGNVFEFYSMAVKDLGDRMVVAVNANLALEGGKDRIAYGDMLFNFTPKGLKGASDAGSLFGVKFTTLNSDSGVAATGIYSGVTAKSVAAQNNGFSSISHRDGHVKKYSSATGLDNYGDLKANDAYFDGMQTGSAVTLNSIASGTKVGDVSMLSSTQLSGMGLNFGQFGATGTQTFGFSFVKPEGFEGNFMSTLFAECFNDGVALGGVARRRVPEPLALAGLALVGGMVVRKRRAAKA